MEGNLTFNSYDVQVFPILNTVRQTNLRNQLPNRCTVFDTIQIQTRPQKNWK